MQNTVNTIRDITETLNQFVKTSPHTHTHTKQNKLKQPQYKKRTKWNNHNTSLWSMGLRIL